MRRQLNCLLLISGLVFNALQVFAAGDDDHLADKGPHGGVVKRMGESAIELRVFKTGNISVFLLDGSQKPRAFKGVVGRIYVQYPNCTVSVLPLSPANETESENDEFVIDQALAKEDLQFQTIVSRMKVDGRVYSNLFARAGSASENLCPESGLQTGRGQKLPGDVSRLALKGQESLQFENRDAMMYLSPLLPGIAHYRTGSQATGVVIGVAGLSGVAVAGVGASQGDSGLIISGLLVWGGSVLFDVIGVSQRNENSKNNQGFLSFDF